MRLFSLSLLFFVSGSVSFANEALTTSGESKKLTVVMSDGTCSPVFVNAVIGFTDTQQSVALELARNNRISVMRFDTASVLFCNIIREFEAKDVSCSIRGVKNKISVMNYVRACNSYN